MEKNYVWTPTESVLSIPNGSSKSTAFLMGPYVVAASAYQGDFLIGATSPWQRIEKQGLYFKCEGLSYYTEWIKFSLGGEKNTPGLFQIITETPEKFPAEYRDAFTMAETIPLSKASYFLKTNLSGKGTFGEAFISLGYITINGTRNKMFSIEWNEGKLYYWNRPSPSSSSAKRNEVPAGANVKLEINDPKVSPALYNFLEENELFKGITYGGTKAYNAETNAWLDPAFKDIKITNTSGLTNRDEFAAWLKANATKQ